MILRREMRILIDGDGCPVIDECIKISNKFKIESIIFLRYIALFR